MNEIINSISKLPNMKFNVGASIEEIKKFENDTKIILPKDYKDWLVFSDGGELFIPGINLYGVSNRPFIRRGDGIEAPENYIVIGRTIYGNALCFKDGEEKIIEWEHESFEEFLVWDNFILFLAESEEMYGDK